MKDIIRPITPEETYRKLKRKVDYAGACTVYSMACIHMRSSAPREEIDAVAGPALAEVGWTLDELYEESILQKSFNEYEGKYG